MLASLVPRPPSCSYPAVFNSEGVVMWTHDVGEGFVEPKETGGEGKGPPTAEGKAHDDRSEAIVPENGSLGRKDGDVAEVRWVLLRGEGLIIFVPYLSTCFKGFP